MNGSVKIGLLIVGHGSRDALANTELEALVAEYREARPGYEIAHAYVELARPALPEGLAALARRYREVVVLPLFLFAAGHVKNDLPLALAEARRAFPATRLSARPGAQGGPGPGPSGLRPCPAVCRSLARTTRHKVLSVEYRLAPEYPFPAALAVALSFGLVLVCLGSR